MTKVQKWFAKLRNRIFFSFVGCFLGIMLLIMGVFQFSSQKYFSQLAVSSTRRELASITDNLESTLQHVINFSISASINDEIIRIAQTYPTLPESEAEQYAVRKKINTIINAIIALSPNIAMWDIMAKDGSFFQAGGYNLSKMDSFDKEQIMKQHQNARQAMITGPYFYLPARETLKENGKYVFLISKPIVDLNTRETYGYLMFFIEASTIALHNGSGKYYFTCIGPELHRKNHTGSLSLFQEGCRESGNTGLFNQGKCCLLLNTNVTARLEAHSCDSNG